MTDLPSTSTSAIAPAKAGQIVSRSLDNARDCRALVEALHDDGLGAGNRQAALYIGGLVLLVGTLLFYKLNDDFPLVGVFGAFAPMLLAIAHHHRRKRRVVTRLARRLGFSESDVARLHAVSPDLYVNALGDVSRSRYDDASPFASREEAVEHRTRWLRVLLLRQGQTPSPSVDAGKE